MPKVGITTTIPVEIVYAAGWTPVDLNNIFITDENPGALVEKAELAGYPRNTCAWIKGLYSTVLKHKDIRTVIAVTQGDCSNTLALMETLQLEGIEIIPFAYPFDRDQDLLRLQLEKLMAVLGTNWTQVQNFKERLDNIRKKVWYIDRLTWEDNLVRGWDNHFFQVNCSDFKGDPDKFEQQVDDFLKRVSFHRLEGYDPRRKKEIRLGYIGVPPIIDDMYDYLEEKGARVVYNEIQRQFSMPFSTDDLVEQYRLYTYPYGIFFRLQDIKKEVEKRQLDGIIHYAQNFCYRQIEDLIIREKLYQQVLTIEGDVPRKIDARTRIKIDAYLEILQ